MRDAWDRLQSELDAWAVEGREVQLWWRDDDATAPVPALTRLLDLAAGHGVPLALAVIPAATVPGLAALLAEHGAQTTVLQHGYTHRNHAAPADKKCELVSPAVRPEVLEELTRGRNALARLFSSRFCPILVPPWNRLADDVVTQLPRLGFAGLSTYTARRRATPVPGLVQVNCHLDLLRWRPQRSFLGIEAALELLVGHLAARRRGAADPGEPSGILSHHQVQDEASWEFLSALLDHLAAHPAVRLLPAAAAFARQPAGVAPRRAAP